MILSRNLPFAVLAAAFAVTLAAGGQAGAAPAPAAAPAAAPAPTSEQAREALNKEEAERARQQVAENWASEDNLKDSARAREALIKQRQEAYAAALAQHEAQKAAYEQALAAWKVQACRARMKEHCLPR